ncbi:sugar kinase [Duganella sp. FT92W]|uniref:Sugar kinase n=1 Tax=Pseudoduganella rivuli TaxID=2666085 RepID=A0A7X2IIP9_9BURK|nr:sugar kinase [Pseudoduganella rivuli]MRV70282.1 sugar kinase [Pseudoduganella rivuli]
MNTTRIVCFGEVLARLSAPNGEMLLQSPRLDVCIGGAEANVAVSLARFGHDATVASALPANALGRAAHDRLRGLGVDTRGIAFRPGRMGLYFLTPGAVTRPSEIIYDRAGSVFANSGPQDYDWPALLDGAGWLHISGVTPAVGPQAAQAVLAAARHAKDAGIRVSFDGNYRASMWAEQGYDGAAILHELIGYADIAFADQRDIALVLQRPELAAPERRADAAAAAFATFPRLGALTATVRVQHSIGHHHLAATLHTRGAEYSASPVAVDGIVDRIGTGDAYAAGVLHGMLQGWAYNDILEFGLAAAALKHSIAGDFNLASAEQVQAARQGAFDVRR